MEHVRLIENFAYQTTFDRPLFELRWKAEKYVRAQQRLKLVRERQESRKWEYWNTFLNRRVERNVETGEFRIIGGQVTVSA